tara:strand:+ start:20165 stop:20869 length:705 start_codon:yes stop_codon:yes gene_type:complete
MKFLNTLLNLFLFQFIFMAEGDEGGGGAGDDKKDDESSLLGGDDDKKEDDKKDEDSSLLGGDDKKGDDKKEDKGDDDKDKAQAPEKYESYEVPEGFAMGEETLSQFNELAKGMNLSQDQAQQLVNVATKQNESFRDEQDNAWNDVRDNWVADIKADKEFGGDNFTETVERAKRARDKFGSDALKEFLNETGFGDNNELVKCFARIDKETSEGGIIEGDSVKGSKTNGQILYPNS